MEKNKLEFKVGDKISLPGFPEYSYEITGTKDGCYQLKAEFNCQNPYFNILFHVLESDYILTKDNKKNL